MRFWLWCLGFCRVVFPRAPSAVGVRPSVSPDSGTRPHFGFRLIGHDSMSVEPVVACVACIYQFSGELFDDVDERFLDSFKQLSIGTTKAVRINDVFHRTTKANFNIGVVLPLPADTERSESYSKSLAVLVPPPKLDESSLYPTAIGQICSSTMMILQMAFSRCICQRMEMMSWL